MIRLSIGIGGSLFQTNAHTGCKFSGLLDIIKKSAYGGNIGHPHQGSMYHAILDALATGLRICLVNGCSSTKQPPLRWGPAERFRGSMQPHRQSTGSAYSCKLKLLLEKGNFKRELHQATWVKMDQHSIHYIKPLQFQRLWPLKKLQFIITNPCKSLLARQYGGFHKWGHRKIDGYNGKSY